jgi:hypothetical protein
LYLRLFKIKKNEDNLELKMTSNGRQPQNIKRGISQQTLVGSYSNSKLKLIREALKKKNGK